MSIVSKYLFWFIMLVVSSFCMVISFVVLKFKIALLCFICVCVSSGMMIRYIFKFANIRLLEKKR